MSAIEVIKHSFYGGVYCKTMIIQEGSEVETHKHNYDHLSILSQGVVAVECDGVTSIHTAPDTIEIKANATHKVTPIEGYGPVIWQCIHATNETGVNNIDDVLIKPIERMKRLPLVLNVQKAVEEINANPDLWNQYNFRTSAYENSPHRKVSDIILRYRDYSEFDIEHPEKFSDKHVSVWWDAIYKLPAIRKIIDSAMLELPDNAKLGGALITKVPARKQVYIHSDAGHWHSDYYDKKILVLLQSNQDQSFNFYSKVGESFALTESHFGEAGEVFEFDNSYYHSVINDSDEDRISLIFAVRTLKYE